VTGQQLAASIESHLRATGEPARAEQERRYLKSDLVHLGVSVPATRQIVRAALAERPALGHRELADLVSALWASRVFECRRAAVEVLEVRCDALRPADIQLVETFLRESGTWALVDELATRVVGDLVERFPELASTLDRWASDEDFWIRRSALLALLLPLRRGEGDFERFGRYADAMLEEREFFIRKAIGWVLRDTGRRRPHLVYDWLAPRVMRASGTTVREAVKSLAEDQRQAIAAARLKPR